MVLQDDRSRRMLPVERSARRMRQRRLVSSGGRHDRSPFVLVPTDSPAALAQALSAWRRPLTDLSPANTARPARDDSTVPGHPHEGAIEEQLPALRCSTANSFWRNRHVPARSCTMGWLICTRPSAHRSFLPPGVRRVSRRIPLMIFLAFLRHGALLRHRNFLKGNST